MCARYQAQHALSSTVHSSLSSHLQHEQMQKIIAVLKAISSATADSVMRSHLSKDDFLGACVLADIVVVVGKRVLVAHVLVVRLPAAG